ncbi:hypothetical protein HA49_02835 [Tatumella morbirosei]|uniref:Pilus assembly protein PilP n=1 Tax=Tatumella morbirosei TaxID=642227 RepID=A0A095TSB6_9GAMM|nr:DNA utilization family protein [Tatumella morbirosei]KGD79532.1 hypothetical protein HA49_02835 [Tatumella morbirosei]
MNNAWFLLCLFTGSVLCSERDPFRPLADGQLCQTDASSEAQWQLRGTLQQQGKQAVVMLHPKKGHYLLLPGQFLPGTLWQVEQIDRGRVILRHRPECRLPAWVMTLTKGYRNEV